MATPTGGVLIRAVEAEQHCTGPCRAKELCWHRLVVNSATTLVWTIPVLLSLVNFEQFCHTHTRPVITNIAWLWRADSCMLLSLAEACGREHLQCCQSAVQCRRCLSTPSLPYMLWSLHTSPHSSANVLITSCKPHLNWTVLEVDYHCEGYCAGTVRFTSGAVRLRSHYR